MSAGRRERFAVLVVLSLCWLVFALHLFRVRPYLWPAGAGVIVTGDVVLTRLSEPRVGPRIRPPFSRDIPADGFVITQVLPLSEPARLGVAPGQVVETPADTAGALRLWRESYRRGTLADVVLRGPEPAAPLAWRARAVWDSPAHIHGEWLRRHFGPLLQTAAFLTGALVLVLLGTRGRTATLMTLALAFSGIANAGSLLGAELALPAVLAAPTLLFAWVVTGLCFPVIGLAILYFPSRAPILDRARWIVPLQFVLPLPVLLGGLLSAGFLLGSDPALIPLLWIAEHSWLFESSFALALASNVILAAGGMQRYRNNPDANERRRIQIVVISGVAAVFAYGINVGFPLLTSLAGKTRELPWIVHAVLQGIVLLPALALPYAVVVKHVFSPRTVLRSSLQYALARRTLSLLILLPLGALLVSLVYEPERSVREVVLGQPLFHLLAIGGAVVAWRYRDQAQRALDRRFFREEYDAREILIELASRVAVEHDSLSLITLVTNRIDSALHPRSIAVLAADAGELRSLSSGAGAIEPLPLTSALVTLLRWSEEPLLVFLDDERSPVARLPAGDRRWLADSDTALLVPLLTGTGDQRSLLGMLALGKKRADEPYTPEDRRLLAGIAGQMSVALDLSRLRQRASVPATPSPWPATPPSRTPSGSPLLVTSTEAAATMAGPLADEGLYVCTRCQRCLTRGHLTADHGCPDDGAAVQPVAGVPAVIDGKYRVDAVLGRGGMGAVFRARDLRLERDVAVKTVRAELFADGDVRARFLREAQLVARLQHPAIVTVFEYGTLRLGASYLVMEYVRGEDLRRLLIRERRLAPGRVADLMSGVAAGIDSAHQAGVLHRDLKPENILLPRGGGAPKVLDFGVAKSVEPSSHGEFATQGVAIVGTPAYMAPEQLRGEAVDARVDVFSLAVMAYELLTGQLPFGNASLFDIAARQAAGPSALPFDGVAAPVATVLRRALSMHPDERAPSAGVLAAELRAAL